MILSMEVYSAFKTKQKNVIFYLSQKDCGEISNIYLNLVPPDNNQKGIAN